MNKFAFGTALAALALTIPAAAPAQRVGPAVVVVVDTNRVFAECTACRAAQAQLQTQVTQLQQLQQQLGAPLQTEAQAIETAGRALNGRQPDAALTARINALRTRQSSANQQLQSREQAIRSTQQHVAQQINARLTPVVNQVMAARGANIAMDRVAAISVAPAIDVTNEVLSQLNQQLPSVSVTPLPQQQQPTGR